MRRLFTAAVLLTLITAVAAAPLWAESHNFKLSRDGSINGTALTAGIYKIELDGQSGAKIFRGKELVTEAKVEVKPMNGGASGSVVQAADGAIREIRLNKKVVVFVR